MDPFSLLAVGAVTAVVDSAAEEAGRGLLAQGVALFRKAFGAHHPVPDLMAKGGADPADLVVTVLGKAAEDPKLLRWLLDVVLHSQELGLPEVSVPRPVRRLPAPAIFVDRDAERAQLSEVRDRKGGGRQAPVVLIAGMPFIGKTTLVEGWGSRAVVDHYTDGYLYVDLQEFRDGGAAVPDRALMRILKELGVPVENVPAALADRVDMYRVLTFGKKLCLVLDNVEQPGEVTMLIPQSGQSLLLAIGIEPLAELLGQGAAFVRVGPFDGRGGRDLLVEIVGADRLAGEPDEEIERVLAACDWIPGKVALAGGILAGSPDWPVSRLRHLLEDDDRRFSDLAGPSMLDKVFAAAYGSLPPLLQLGYRRLGLLPGLEFPVEAAVELFGLPEAGTRALLERLARKHLLTDCHPDRYPSPRYGITRTVRSDARDRIEREDSEDDKEAAWRRLLDWYVTRLQYADQASSSRKPMRMPRERPELERASNPFTGPEDALLWTDAEFSALLEVQRRAFAAGAYEEVLRIADSAWPYCTNYRPLAEAVVLYDRAVAAAQHLDDQGTEAWMRCRVSRFHIELDDVASARRHVDRAQSLVSGDPARRGSVLEFTGLVEVAEERPDRALAHFEEARDLHRAAENPRGERLMTQMMGSALRHLGEYERAVDTLTEVLEVLPPDEDRFHALIRMDRAEARFNLHRYAEAEADLVGALPYLERQHMSGEIQLVQALLRSVRTLRGGRS